LIENLIKDYGIILTGRSIERRKDEQDELRKMISDLPSVVNLVDKLSLEEFILIIRRCSCYISSDTGPLHIAKALDTPLVALFGPSSGKREIGPYRFAERYAILQSEFRCSPCGWRISKDCLENRRSVCMERFSIEKIAGEVKRLIGIDRRL
jgi:ADP-heptose:LPS heptosyltransferase